MERTKGPRRWRVCRCGRDFYGQLQECDDCREGQRSRLRLKRARSARLKVGPSGGDSPAEVSS